MHGAAATSTVVALLMVAAASPPPRTPSNRTTAPGRSLIVLYESTQEPPGGDALGAIWIIRPGGFPRKLRGPCTDCYSSPRWSPDGTRIVYADSTAAGESAVFAMSRDGSGTRMLCERTCGRPLAWSPDGKHLVVGTTRGLGVLDLSSEKLSRLWAPAHEDVLSVDWSPDGKRIALDDSSNRVWVTEPTGRNAHVIAENVGYPRWSVDGRTVVSDSRGKGFYVVSAAGGPLVPILRLPEGTALAAAWSPDGRRIVYSGRHGLYVLDRATRRVVRLDARSRICSRRPVDDLGSGATACSDLDWRGTS